MSHTRVIKIIFAFVTLLTANLFSEEERDTLLHFVTTVLCTLTLTEANFIQKVKAHSKGIFDRVTRQGHTRDKRANLIKAVIHALFLQHYLIHHPELLILPTEEQVIAWIFESNPSLTMSEKSRTKLLADMINLQMFSRAVNALHNVGLEGNNNVQLFLQVGAMLEGTGRVYATGGGPAILTKCRKAIVQTITGYSGRASSQRTSPVHVAEEFTNDMDLLDDSSVTSFAVSSADSVSSLFLSDADNLNDWPLNFAF